MVEEPG